MRDHVFTFPNENTEQKFLEMAEAAGVKAQWVAIDPNSEYDGEHRVANEEVWDALSTCVREIISDQVEDQKNTPSWPRTPFEQWTQTDKRRFIFLAVTEFACVGDRLPENSQVLRAFREGRLPNP